MGWPGRLGLILLLGLGVPAAAEAARYVLAPTILQSDPEPDRFRLVPGAAGGAPVPDADLANLNKLFTARFEAAFPGLNRPLGENARLDPGTPTLVVVPRLSMVRLTRDTIAGSLDRFEAVIVGDMTLLDPWTMAKLFAATRMATRAVEVSKDRSEAERQRAIDHAFDEAARAWVGDCLQEMTRGAHPFTLKANILPTQDARLRSGGFWPFGALDGVQGRMTLRGRDGRTVRVRELFDRFCVLENPANPKASLGSGEEYQATLVSAASPAERREPRVALRWIGLPPAPPMPEIRKVPTGAGWSILLANYLSKQGGLALLPIEDSSSQGAWLGLSDYLKDFSQATDGILDQDVIAMRAKENPDLLVEIGIADAYHGTFPGEQGATDHRFLVTWGVRWFERGEDKDDPLIFRGVHYLTEEKRVRTLEGVRDLDLSSIWFNLCRNGIIKLAKEIEGGIHRARSTGRGVAQGGGKVAWAGAAPGPGRRLERLRAQGEVRSQAGKSLGTYFARPERLSAQDLGRCDRGDEIRFDPGDKPRVQFLLPDLGPRVDLAPQWFQAGLAARVEKLSPMDLVLLEGTAPSGTDLPDTPYLRLRVEAPVAESQGAGVKAGHTYRLRLYPRPFDAETEPAFKLGLAHSGVYPSSAPYRPEDTRSAALAEAHAALDELVKRAATSGLTQALPKE